MAKLGRILFAVAIGFFGIQDIFYGHFLGGVPPAPPWTAGGSHTAYLLGASFIVLSLALLANQQATRAGGFIPSPV